MKLKVRPEDFVVKELIDLPIIKKGPYTILKLKKRYWNTLDVIDFVARKLSLSKKLFSRLGLKDRYSLSTQYISFKGNFCQSIKEKNFSLIPIGRTPKAITAHNMVGNSFSITLRSLHQKELHNILKNYAEVKKYGLPNYFDEQRFGSARHRKGFFAKELMLKHYNGALKLILCHPYREDSKRNKYFKNFCREHWREWKKCLPIAPRTYKKIIRYLIDHPKDYKNAIKTIDKELLNLYLLAYQSYLFNQTVYTLVEKYGIDNVDVSYSVGHFLFYRRLIDVHALQKLLIPMLNEKVTLRNNIGNTIKSILEREAIRLKDFALKKMRFRGARFKSFPRSPILLPTHFALGQPQDDELYPNRKKLILTFTLPPGSYATLLIKRLII